MPTPSGVPVEMTSPGSRVITLEMNAIASATGKTIADVCASCSTSPPIVSVMRRSCGSPSSSAVTIHGPNGPNVSMLLPASHCEVRSW
jgi:hypothetical protein